ncbi:MAG: SCO family protein [Pseudolabrys sp.]|nr:SCO family protein [Pseudolabrys sp.]
MSALNSRVTLILAAFFGGLFIFLTAIYAITGRAPSTSASAIGGPFHLIDQNGQPVTDQDFKGKPFLVFFGYTHCPDVCPATLFDISEVLRALGPDAERTGAIYITVDPERDTAPVMKDYLSSFDPHLRAGIGNPDQIAETEKAYRVYAKKVPGEGNDYTMDHTALVYLMDKQGRFVAPFSLKRRPEESAAELRKYM